MLFVITIQTLSLWYIFSTGHLNGDFIYYSRYKFESLIISYIFSLLPFFFLYFKLQRNVTTTKKSISDFKYFSIFVYFILSLNIIFSIFFKVGLVSSDNLYQAPVYLKPLIVIVNRIDVYLLTGIFLLNTKFSSYGKFFVVILLITLSISRASVYVFLFLFLIYLASRKIKINYRLFIIIIVLMLITIYTLPFVFMIREELRGSENFALVSISDNSPIFDFIWGKILGRVSNLSSVLYFQDQLNILRSIAPETSFWDYLIEFFKPIWGSFTRYVNKNYTYVFTNIFDPYALDSYGIMYGLLSVLTISYFKSFGVLIFNILFVIIICLSIVWLSKHIFGYYYREMSFIFLFGPIMSGVPAELGQLFFNLIILFILHLVFRNLNIAKLIRKPGRDNV
jgi:hypothetical protein